MTPLENPALDAAPTFLVAPDGIVTLSTDLDLAPRDEQRSARGAPGTKRRSALPLIDGGTSSVEATFDPFGEVERATNAKDVAALVGVARRLVAAAFLSQASGGRAWCKAVIAPEPAGSAIPGGMAANDAFSRVSRACVDQVVASAALLCRSGGAEALHQCRVGLRRLRAALTAFRQILPREDLDRWKAETKWLAGELDAARELDAFIEHVACSTNGPIHAGPLLAAFGERLVLARAISYEAAVAAVQSQRFATLVMDFTEWVEAAPRPRDDDSKAARRSTGDASVLAVQALERLNRRLRKAGKHLEKLDSAGRHELRIKAKKLRYAADFFSETFGKSARKRHGKFVTSLKRLVDALGELNDMATAGPCARAVVGRSPELAFCAGEIVGRRNSDEPRLIARAVRAYRQWSSVGPFWA
jgi:triphosphatase